MSAWAGRMKEISSYIEQISDKGEDSLAVINAGDTILLCIADGAGGMSGGLQASESVVEAVSSISTIKEYKSPDDIEAFMRDLDQKIFLNKDAGETTAIIVMIQANVIMGASIGDSECWLISDELKYELTTLQNRKPLLGSGSAVPIGFGPLEFDGSIVMGSDGLFKYMNINTIISKIEDQSVTAKELIELLKQSNGCLQDDASAIICR